MNNEVMKNDELQELMSKNKELEIIVAVQKQQLAELQPKVSYYDMVLQCKDALPLNAIAHDYGWSVTEMNEYLCDKGVQFKLGIGGWLLSQKYADEGYTYIAMYNHEDNEGEIHTSIYTHWTQKGRLFIYDLLKRDGILPLIER